MLIAVHKVCVKRLRIDVEYNMFIDSLSERKKSKNAIKGFHPCINYHFSRQIIPYLKEPVI